MNEDYAKYLDENSAKELLDLILSYLEDPIEARKSNPRILSPMIRIYFRKSDQLQNMSTSDRNFWHEIFCSLLWWELDHRAQLPATTKVNIFQKTYGEPVKILIDGLDVSSDKMLENPDLSVEVTIELQDEENTELQSCRVCTTSYQKQGSEILQINKVVHQKGYWNSTQVEFLQFA